MPAEKCFAGLEGQVLNGSVGLDASDVINEVPCIGDYRFSTTGQRANGNFQRFAAIQSFRRDSAVNSRRPNWQHPL